MDAIRQDVSYMTLAEAAGTLPHRPHASCLWRWCRKGVLGRNGRRIRLGHVRIGGKIFTTQTWLRAFGQELAQADAEHFEQELADDANRRSDLPPTRQKRMEQIEQARMALAAAGI